MTETVRDAGGALKVAVVGTGGVGGYFGGRLAEAGHDVGFVARGAHLDALRREGLHVDSPAGDFTVAPARASDDTHDIGEVDVVLLCVKTWQLPPAIAALKPLVGPDTAVVTLQNGVEAPEQVAQEVGRGAVLPGTAKIIAHLDGPGRVRHVGGPGSLAFTEWDNRATPRVERLRAALAGAGVSATVPDDIWAELWAKFLFVVPFGGLGTVTDAPFGVLRSRPGTRRLLAEGMTEIERVARALDVRLPDDIVTRTLDFIDQQPAEGTSSLQRDIRAGRPSELDAWNGSVVRLGGRTGTPTPVNGYLYEVASVLAARAGDSAR
ncbi:2-dehydropantoate 2-reductase [Streptomyces flavofungini]|uniref:2-dehydropantoate 2-reductase n=1 Tax=Streptomyces flavofungini TaxID=68200 RepID=A0ABS0XAK2_9ACTN|nr:2-dehydropantoate 2-reductase [Streptomyces flavofungini]MBJ3809974.1 2-dehydropantoate 2-reductase [Streptomyces flavofungini]GHC53676.1 2-dehydropantoate 2-reductase [Streptomyces flavofungini]